VIVTLSNASVSKEGYVQRELRFVLDLVLEKPEETIFILPVRLDDCERPSRLRRIHGIDYFPQRQKDWAFQPIFQSLKVCASHLDRSTDKLDQPIPLSQDLSLHQPSKPVTTYPLVNSNQTASVPQLYGTIKRNRIWI